MFVINSKLKITLNSKMIFLCKKKVSDNFCETEVLTNNNT